MTKSILSGVALLSVLLLRARAQLLSCSDVDCPTNGASARCQIENTTLTQIGVANFSSSLSPHPLTWTVGYTPESFTYSTNQRRYYLSTPQGLDLDTRTDVTGCGLFFTGVEAGLSFVKPDGTLQNLGTISGTCTDALGSACVSNLTSQARELAANLTASGDFQCSDLARVLQGSPPESCTLAGTWGDITAKTITGSGSPSVLQLGDCNPTINTTYDTRGVATFPQIANEPFGNNITPLMTIFATTGNATNMMTSTEVNLNCMKQMEDLPPNQTTFRGSGEALALRHSWPSMLAALVGFLATSAFMD